jgi:uncharacterized phiE125 gp8 family phage protein
MYSVKVTTKPTKEPISLEEAKTHLRTYGDHEDLNIDRIYIPTARQHCEDRTNRQFVTATLELSLDGFPPSGHPILIPRAPLQSVTSVTYQASDGTETVLSTDDYIVDTRHEPGRIIPAFGKAWPATRCREAAATVLVEFQAGYGGPSDVPAGLRAAMLLLISHYYYHREAVVVGTNASELPMAVETLLEQHGFGDEFTDYGVR